MQNVIKLFALVIMITALSCQENQRGTKVEVEGEIKNFESTMAQFPGLFTTDSLKLVLLEVPFGGDAQPIQLDSTYVSAKNPHYNLSAKAPKQSLYEVAIENGPMLPFVNDAGKIKLDFDLTNKEDFYSVSGSSASQEIHDFIFGFSEKSILVGTSLRSLDSLKETGSSDSAIIAGTEQKNQYFNDLNNYLKQTVIKAKNPISAAFALGLASRTLNTEEYDSTLNAVIAKHPSDPSLQYLKNQLKEAQLQMEAQTDQLVGTSWIGKPAPEMSMPDVNGKEVSIASFKGKYVLVDFWASWCGPCRMENPAVVKAYNQFKNKNFTILGVSLDKDRDKWLEAIEKDNLTWTHISDLAFWNSKSVDIFNFQGIPYNVLIDPDGIIIAESLRGEALSRKLSEVLN